MTKKVIIKLIKYSAVGVLGTLTHIIILVTFVELFNQDPVLSSTCGFIIVVVISYYLNHFWTFQSDRCHLYSFPRYVIVSLLGLSLNTGIMYLTVNILNWWYLSGQMIVIIIVPISNFILNYFWSFGYIKKNSLIS